MTNQVNMERNKLYQPEMHPHPEEINTLNTHTKNELQDDLQEDNNKARFIKDYLSKKWFTNIKNSSDYKFFIADGSNNRIVITERNMDMNKNTIDWDIP